MTWNFASGGVHDLVSAGGMSSSSHPLATAAGVQMLLRGGNAADAALATAFALVVCEPAMSHLGGQGNALVHMVGDGRTVALDYYPTAPAAARPDMYEWIPSPTQGGYRFWTRDDANTTGALSVAVPGSMAGWLYVHSRWASLPLDVIVEPAVQYARRGAPLTVRMASMVAENRDRLARFPAAAAIFLHPDGSPRETGEVIVQPDLARTLELIAREGQPAFYQGEIAEAIVNMVQMGGGILTRDDLAGYPEKQFLVMEPEQTDYHGYRIAASPATSSGVLLPIMNLLEGFPLSSYEPMAGEKLHLLAEAMKLVFADREQYLGDPAFVNIPLAGLLAKSYAAERRRLIRADRANYVGPATEPGSIGPGDPWAHQTAGADQGKFTNRPGDGPSYFSQQTHTTHHSHVDRWGNFISMTQSLGDGFGSAMMVPGHGFFINNAMKLFDPRPGRSNSVAPHKRPGTAPCPTMVLREGVPVMALGSPSGTRIINAIAQTLVHVIDHGLGLQYAVNLPRIHWSGDEFELEQDVPEPAQRTLAALGHQLQVRHARSPWFGSVQAVARDPETGLCHGATDPRRQGAVAGAYLL